MACVLGALGSNFLAAQTLESLEQERLQVQEQVEQGGLPQTPELSPGLFMGSEDSKADKAINATSVPVAPIAPIASMASNAQKMDSVHFLGIGSSNSQINDGANTANIAHLLDASSIPAGTGNELAAIYTAHLRNAGYPIAQVLYLPQDQQAALPKAAYLRVYLGRVGKVTIQNTSVVDAQTLQAQATQALCRDGQNVEPDLASEPCYLQGKNLERAVAMLKLNPGVTQVQASLSSQDVGLGQTQVSFDVSGSDSSIVGFVSVDNYGAPSTGSTRYGGAIGANSLLVSGDVFYLNALDTNQGALTGLLDWTLPLTNDGLRLDLQASQSQVVTPLGSSQMQGVSQSYSMGLIHPLTLLMSEQETAQFNIGYVHNNNNLVGVSTLQDRQIPFASAGIAGNTGPASGADFASWYAKLTVGKPSDSAQGANQSDANGPQVLNTFSKLYAQIIKRQELGVGGLNAGINLRGQAVTRNVDPSMMLGFGGIDGARAYPVTEGAFSTGVITSADLRAGLYQQDKVNVYASIFADYVAGQTYKNLWTGWNAANPTLQNTRQLYDYGIGLSGVYEGFAGQISLSRKFSGSAPSVISSTAANGRIWASASWSWR